MDILIDNLIEIKKKEKRISLASNNKTETCNKNGALQITFYSDFIKYIMKSVLGG